MIEGLDLVVLRRGVDAHGLKEGDVGAVVYRYAGGEAYEVEFVTGQGRTVAVVTLEEKDVRSLGESEILHAREVASTATA